MGEYLYVSPTGLWIFIFDTIITTAARKSGTANSNQKDHPSLKQAAQALNT